MFFSLSCNFFQNKTVILKVVNNSNIKYDSIKLHLYLNYDTTFYNVKPKFEFLKKVELKNTEYERGAKITSSLIAFKDSTFYYFPGGLMDYPYGKMESEYSYYVWDNGITNNKDIHPIGFLLEKHRISEYKDSED